VVGDTENFWRGEASPSSHVQAGWFRDSFWGLYKRETEGGGRQGVGEVEREGEVERKGEVEREGRKESEQEERKWINGRRRRRRRRIGKRWRKREGRRSKG